MESRVEVVVKELGPLQLVGVSSPLVDPLGRPVDKAQVIPALWRSLLSRTDEVVGRKGGERFAIIENDLPGSQATPVMRAMVAVASPSHQPAWLEAFTLPRGMYATFEHRGPPKDIGHTVLAARDSGYPKLFDRQLEVFVYAADYDPKNADASVFCWLPLS